MPFTSITFVFYFLPCFLAVYLVLPKTHLRNAFLLMASLCFYAWGDFSYVPLLALSAIANYALGRALARQHGRTRGLLLWTGILLNLVPLILFKYADFLIHASRPVLEPLGLQAADLKLHLPLGISFYTFKAISYLVDVHRKDAMPERDPVVFAAYLAMFPQILAGPIERMPDAQGEMRERGVTLAKFRLGAEYFIIGMAQKLLIANPLARPADGAFSVPAADLTAPLAWLGAGAYTLQIYFDFAGYTNMAIGLGHMMGFTFPPNFNYPYAAKSITDFWQRWHITLSSWLRDYIWYPLGANRKGKLRTYLNVLIVFGLCGLWHGANYTFLVWGLFHGFLVAMERAWLLSVLKRLGGVIATVYAGLMVMIGWVLFRADSLSQALHFLRVMAGGSPILSNVSVFQYLSADVVAAFVVGTLFAFPFPRLAWDFMIAVPSARLNLALRAASTAVLMTIFIASLMALAEGSHNPFLYFRF